MESGSSFAPMEKRVATQSESGQSAPRRPDVIGVPWGGPEFLRLLALFFGSFLATCCIILGGWYLVLRPVPATSVDVDEMRSAVLDEVPEPLKGVAVGGLYEGRFDSRPVALKVIMEGGELVGVVRRDGEEFLAAGTIADDGGFEFVEQASGMVWSGVANGQSIEGRVLLDGSVQGPFKVER